MEPSDGTDRYPYDGTRTTVPYGDGAKPYIRRYGVRRAQVVPCRVMMMMMMIHGFGSVRGGSVRR